MPSSKHIIIVTQEHDGHADNMVRYLRELGHEPIRLHTQDMPVFSNFLLHFAHGKWSGTLQMRGRVITIEQIHSIWWRRPGPFAVPDTFNAGEQQFIQEELQHTLAGLWDTLDCYWMSFPHNLRLAGWKPSQLQRAAALGLEVPESIISTDPEQVRAFYEKHHGAIIYKTLSDPSPHLDVTRGEGGPRPAQIVYTTRVTDQYLQVFEHAHAAPCLFQEYIPKKYELRVTIIGDEVFTAAIHSQEHSKTQTDWRHYDVEIPYRKAELPPDVAAKCYRLMKSYGLNYSAMDLIVTPDGRYVFLESNPNGQFLFVQLAVPELRMLEAVASCLIKG